LAPAFSFGGGPSIFNGSTKGSDAPGSPQFKSAVQVVADRESEIGLTGAAERADRCLLSFNEG